jgi:hypothetical protein
MNVPAKTTTLLALLVVFVIVAGLLLALSETAKQQRLLSITSFEQCAAAGYPVMTSYPAQCRTPDGRLFVDESAAPSQGPYVGDGCAVGGCSGQICGAAGDTDQLISTCEYRAEYGCYRNARCEMQQNGSCGWTPTNSLNACIAEASAGAAVESR